MRRRRKRGKRRGGGLRVDITRGQGCCSDSSLGGLLVEIFLVE